MTYESVPNRSEIAIACDLTHDLGLYDLHEELNAVQNEDEPLDLGDQLEEELSLIHI